MSCTSVSLVFAPGLGQSSSAGNSSPEAFRTSSGLQTENTARCLDATLNASSTAGSPSFVHTASFLTALEKLENNATNVYEMSMCVCVCEQK